MHQGLQQELESALVAHHIDHHTVNWQDVQRSRYLVHQYWRYEYPGPITELHQQLYILPPEYYGDQSCVAYRFAVAPPVPDVSYHLDTFENRKIMLYAPYVERSITFEVWLLVERNTKTAQAPSLPASTLTDERLLLPSALTRPDEDLREVAQQFQRQGLQGIALAESINAWVYQHMQYVRNVTSVHTTAIEVMHRLEGVCQDYAHLMIALCRLCNLPARYVSGHLLGEGGTHAWVEVIVPADDQRGGAIAVAFDPTHGCRANLSYITIATGRDYYDVAPTSGTFCSTFSGDLSTFKNAKVVMVEFNAA